VFSQKKTSMTSACIWSHSPLGAWENPNKTMLWHVGDLADRMWGKARVANIKAFLLSGRWVLGLSWRPVQRDTLPDEREPKSKLPPRASLQRLGSPASVTRASSGCTVSWQSISASHPQRWREDKQPGHQVINVIVHSMTDGPEHALQSNFSW
jgi:hypothetical protein